MTVKVAVVGVGAVGSRCARQLASTADVSAVQVFDRDRSRSRAVVASLGPPAQVAASVEDAVDWADVVVFAHPEPHRPVAELALDAGSHVVSTADTLDDVRDLLELDAEARERNRAVVVGAGFAPGLTDLLARHAAGTFDTVLEVHVAKSGTGGPACARVHHDALGSTAIDWRDGAWVRRRGGSGRELCWFPDPVAGQDCYRAALPDALLLVPLFPGVQRVTARVAATRRDRFTAWLPMFIPPHPEGMVGAIRVELRGRRGRIHETMVYGAIDRPGVAAGAVASTAAILAGTGSLVRPGAASLAELVQSPLPVLADLARRGVKAAVFEGASA